MKRLSIIFVSLLVLAGCTLTGTGTSPKKAAEDLFGKYQSLNAVVLDQLDAVITSKELTATQTSDYKELMRKQYQNLTYTIKNEAIDGDTAIVTVEIEVNNYAKASKDADVYLAAHPTEFVGEDGKPSSSLFEDYKINQLKAVNDSIKYNLDLGVSKVENNWHLNELSDVERQKVHGLYIE